MPTNSEIDMPIALPLLVSQDLYFSPYYGVNIMRIRFYELSTLCSRACGLGLLITVVVQASASDAATVGINFSNGTATYDLAASDVAGVVADDNWNNVGGASLSGNVTTSNLVDGSGIATTLDITTTFTTGGRAGPTTSSSPNDKLFNRHAWFSGGSETVTIDEISYATYDVYVYTGSDTSGADGRTYGFTIGSTTIYSAETAGDSFNDVDGFIQAVGTSHATANSSNYVLFSGLTGSSFTLSADASSGRASLDGLQIVEATVVPEPNAMILILSGMIGVVVAGTVRRRNRRS